VNKVGSVTTRRAVSTQRTLLAQRKSKVKGKIKRQNSNPKAQSLNPKAQDEAEACFLQALKIARSQEAKSLELHAAISLVKLRQQQATHASRNTQHVSHNRLEEAHRLLSEVYHWFTEGFETKDLQDAKTLLDTLA
jgi:hypothetical protein